MTQVAEDAIPTSVGKADITDSFMARLREMSSPEVLSLQQGVESLAFLRKGPLSIAADSQALYLLSGGE